MKAGKRDDSLKKRYSSKLGANGIDFLLSLITAGIAPRGLGPAAYGNFEFLSSFFMQFVGFFDAGTSTCFYTKLSKRPDDTGLVRFYWLVVLGLSGLTVMLVLAALLLNLNGWLWPGQEVAFIGLAAVWGLLTWYSRVIAKVVDAYGLTVPGEMCRIAQRVVGTVVLLSLFYWTGFTLTQGMSFSRSL